jgi:hypothetical protein
LLSRTPEACREIVVVAIENAAASRWQTPIPRPIVFPCVV